MDEKNESKHLTVIIPLEKYEALIRDSEKLRALEDGIWRNLEKTGYGETINNDLISVYAAIFPEDYEAFQSNYGSVVEGD
jgi:hypothetical protein